MASALAYSSAPSLRPAEFRPVEGQLLRHLEILSRHTRKAEK